jgi:hypothetical protein
MPTSISVHGGGSVADDRERQIARSIYDHTLELWRSQGDEIAALQQAMHALQRSHEHIGELLRLVGELVKVS